MHKCWWCLLVCCVMTRACCVLRDDVVTSCGQDGAGSEARGETAAGGEWGGSAPLHQDLLWLDEMQPSGHGHMRQGQYFRSWCVLKVYTVNTNLIKVITSYLTISFGESWSVWRSCLALFRQSSLSLWSRLSVLLNFLPPEADVTKAGASSDIANLL